MTAARLVTIPFSHYCEKARWALDRARVPYVEEPHLPMFAWAPALRAGRRRTVPVLRAGTEVHADSHAIVLFSHVRAPQAGLYPDDVARDVETLEARLDTRLGPAARRIAYAWAMPHRDVVARLFFREGPRLEIAAARAALPAMIALMKRGLRIDAAGVARSEAALAEVEGEIARRLEAGGPWLFGDRFTAADLTLAALAAPLVAPPELDGRLGSLAEMPADMRAQVERRRATPLGRLALRAYRQER